jgi:hypothetical protein
LWRPGTHLGAAGTLCDDALERVLGRV